MPIVTDEQLINFSLRMSDILIGYREGSLDEMLARAQELINIEKQHNRQEKVAELFTDINNLKDLADDIEQA